MQVSFHLQLRPEFEERDWHTTFGDLIDLKAVKITQERPTQPAKDCVVLKMNLDVPDHLVSPPELNVDIPDTSTDVVVAELLERRNALETS